MLERDLRDARLPSIAPAPPVTGLTVRVGLLLVPPRPTPTTRAGTAAGSSSTVARSTIPGSTPEFADRTGLDPDVVELPRGDPAVAGFFDGVLVLVERQVAVYEGRGFTSLDVQFGCTGGQHRSVYFAERLARAIGAKFPSRARRRSSTASAAAGPIATAPRVAPADPAPLAREALTWTG